MADVNLGTIYSSVELRTAQLTADKARAEAILTGMASDVKSIAASMSKSLEDQLGKSAAAAMQHRKAVMTQLARDIGRDMTIAGGAITAGFGLAVESGSALEKKLNEVRNNTTMTDGEFAKMVGTIKSMGAATSAPLKELADGFMHIVNFGIPAAQATTVLNEAMKSAVSTGANTASTANILAAVLHGFGLNVSEAGRAMNVLHLAAAQGNMTLEQFNQAAGPTLAFAAALGMKLPDAAAAMAALTRHGFDAAEASTQVRNVLTHILSVSPKATEALEALSKASGVNLVRDFKLLASGGMSLEDVMKAMHEAADRVGMTLPEAFSKVIPAIRGGIGGMVLAGRAAKDYRDILDTLNKAMRGDIDPTSKAYAETQKTLAFQTGVLRNNFELLATKILSSVSPALYSLLHGLKEMLDEFNKLPDGTKTAIIQIGAVGGVALIAGGRILSMAANLSQLISNLKVLGALPAFSRLFGGAGVSTAVITTGYMLKDMAENPKNPDIQYFGALGGSAGSGYLKLRDKMVAENAKRAADAAADAEARRGMAEGRIAATPANLRKALQESFEKSIGDIDAELSAPLKDAARSKKLRADRAALIRDAQKQGFEVYNADASSKTKTMADLLGGDDSEDARDKAKDAAHQRRQAEIEIIELQQGALAKLKAARRKADDDYITSINDGTRTQTEAFAIRKGRYAEAQRDYLSAVDAWKKKLQEKALAAEGASFPANEKKFLDEVRRNGAVLLSEAHQAAMAGFQQDFEEAAQARANRANMRETFRGLLWGITPRAGAINKADLSLANRSEGGDSPEKVQADIERLSNLRATKSTESFQKVMEVTSKAYAFDYEQTNVAGENYLRFLEYKQSLTDRYSEEWMSVQREMQKVQDDLNKSSADSTKAKVDVQARVWKEMLKDIQRSSTDILANLFGDLLSGHKNPFQSFLDAFRQMLIRMAAELAASEVVKGIAGLFGGGKKGGGSGSGGGKFGGELGAGIGTAAAGPLGGLIGGAIGGMLGFADGGFVPGLPGAPVPAVVHGGEFVLSRQMLAAGAGGGGGVTVNLNGAMHVRTDADIPRLAREIGDHIYRQQRVRQGSG